MRAITITILALLLSVNGFTTSQAPDILFYGGQVFHLFSCPLESLYADEKDRPDFRLGPKGAISTGNWRGYVAYWEIKRDKLYLLGLESWIKEKRRIHPADLKALF